MTLLAEILSTKIDQILPLVESVYKDFHLNPELSMQETRTASIAAKMLREAGYEVTEGVGKTGVVGLLHNGKGATVMLRADMDALPVKEATGLSYASDKQGVNANGETVPLMHACGHDMHTASLIGVAMLMAQSRDVWSGTLMVVFQPAEETAQGSLAMVEDGMTERFPKPEVVLGQHVMPQSAGTVGYRAGHIMSSGDSLLVRFFGQGSHGSQPQNSIDPIVMASAAVLRLQTIVSREVHPQSSVVVSVGEFHAGTAENIIPAEAYLKLNIRTTDDAVRDQVLAAVKRICIAEAQASNAPREPEFSVINSFPLTENDPTATGKIAESFKAFFGDRAFEAAPLAGSEDFSRFARAWKVPYSFWFIGGADPEAYAQAERDGTVQQSIPMPHSPFYAPVIDPTLRTSIEAMLIASGNWLMKP